MNVRDSFVAQAEESWVESFDENEGVATSAEKSAVSSTADNSDYEFLKLGVARDGDEEKSAVDASQHKDTKKETKDEDAPKRAQMCKQGDTCLYRVSMQSSGGQVDNAEAEGSLKKYATNAKGKAQVQKPGSVHFMVTVTPQVRTRPAQHNAHYSLMNTQHRQGMVHTIQERHR